MTATRLAKDVRRKKRHDQARRRARSQREQRRGEHHGDVTVVQPFALSTRRTVKGALPGGVTWNDKPQWPTITSADAECE